MLFHDFRVRSRPPAGMLAAAEIAAHTGESRARPGPASARDPWASGSLARQITACRRAGRPVRAQVMGGAGAVSNATICRAIASRPRTAGGAGRWTSQPERPVYLAGRVRLARWTNAALRLAGRLARRADARLRCADRLARRADARLSSAHRLARRTDARLGFAGGLARCADAHLRLAGRLVPPVRRPPVPYRSLCTTC